MKTTKRTVEITVERSEKFFIRNRRIIFANCGFCKRQVRMISPEKLAETKGISLHRIYRLIETDQIHFTETGNGQILICIDSLFKE